MFFAHKFTDEYTPFLVQAGSHKILVEVSIILIRETCKPLFHYFIPSFSRRRNNYKTSIFVSLFHLQSIQIIAFRNTQTSFGQKYSSTQHLPTFTARPQDLGIKYKNIAFYSILQHQSNVRFEPHLWQEQVMLSFDKF